MRYYHSGHCLYADKTPNHIYKILTLKKAATAFLSNMEQKLPSTKYWNEYLNKTVITIILL